MKKSRLRINQKIEVRKDPDLTVFKSSIQELDEETLSITIPVRKGQRLMLQPGDQVRVQFAIDDASYSFETTMLARKKSDHVAFFVLARPSVMARVQRRESVRFPITLNVTFSLLRREGEKSPDREGNRGQTVDISAGGMQVASSVSPWAGDKVQVALQLGDECLPEINQQGEVAWAYYDDWLKTARFGVRFTDISEEERERIVAYIFRCMRRRPQMR